MDAGVMGDIVGCLAPAAQAMGRARGDVRPEHLPFESGRRHWRDCTGRLGSVSGALTLGRGRPGYLRNGDSLSLVQRKDRC